MTIDRYPPINPRFPHMLHGGDYNPDQWPEAGVGRGHAPDEAGALQRHDRGDLRLDEAGAGRGPVRVRLAGSRHGSAGRERRLCRAGDASGARPAWLAAEVSGGAARPARPRPQPVRRPPQPLLHLADLPREDRPDQRQAGRALHQPPGAARLAPLQRIQRRVPLRPVPGRVPGVAQDEVRHARRAQPRLVDRLLEPHRSPTGRRSNRPPRSARPRCTA